MPIAHGSTSARNLTIPERLSLRFVRTIFALQRVGLKAILGDVDANSDIFPHGRPPSWWRSSDHLSALKCPLGGAVHIIKGGTLLALEAVKRALPAADATTAVSMAAALATLMRVWTAIPTTSAQATFAHNLGVPPLAYKTAPVAPLDPTRRDATAPTQTCGFAHEGRRHVSARPRSAQMAVRNAGSFHQDVSLPLG